MEISKTKTISFTEFWNELKYHISDYFDEKNPNEYPTEDYGTIYRNSISNKLQKLGVDSKRYNSFTDLIFNHKKIMKNASQYNISIQR
jgi:lipoate-protein ligase A